MKLEQIPGDNVDQRTLELLKTNDYEQRLINDNTRSRISRRSIV